MNYISVYASLIIKIENIHLYMLYFLKNVIKMILICTKYAHDIFTVTMCIKISLKHNLNINLHMNCLVFRIIVSIIKIYALKRLNNLHFRFLTTTIWMHLLWTLSILDSFLNLILLIYVVGMNFCISFYAMFYIFLFFFPFLFLMNLRKISHFCNSQRKCKNLSIKLRH